MRAGDNRLSRRIPISRIGRDPRVVPCDLDVPAPEHAVKRKADSSQTHPVTHAHLGSH